MRKVCRGAGCAMALFLLCIPFAAARVSGIPWVPFHWTSLTSNGKTFSKAAILVPIKIRSYPETYYMEFDTGARASPFRKVPKKVQQELLGIYEAPESVRKKFRADWKKNEFHLELHVGKTGIDYSGIMIKTAPPADMSAPYPMIGTLGQNSFYDTVVLLDFVHDRIALVPAKNLKKSWLAGVTFVPMDYRNNRLFVPVTVNGVHYNDDFFYDSGSSLFPMITTPDLWEQITGHSLKDPKNTGLVVHAWGKPVVMVGAKLKGKLSIGPVTLSSPTVYVRKSGGDKGQDLATAKYPLKGVIGNAPFYDCCMIVIDMPDHRFGIKILKRSVSTATNGK